MGAKADDGREGICVACPPRTRTCTEISFPIYSSMLANGVRLRVRCVCVRGVRVNVNVERFISSDPSTVVQAYSQLTHKTAGAVCADATHKHVARGLHRGVFNLGLPSAATPSLLWLSVFLNLCPLTANSIAASVPSVWRVSDTRCTRFDVDDKGGWDLTVLQGAKRKMVCLLFATENLLLAQSISLPIFIEC